VRQAAQTMGGLTEKLMTRAAETEKNIKALEEITKPPRPAK